MRTLLLPYPRIGAGLLPRADMTEEQMNRELHKQYNDGLAPADQMTFSQWQSAKNEQGGKTGLDLKDTQRLDSKKVGDMMP